MPFVQKLPPTPPKLAFRRRRPGTYAAAVPPDPIRTRWQRPTPNVPPPPVGRPPGGMALRPSCGPNQKAIWSGGRWICAWLPSAPPPPGFGAVMPMRAPSYLLSYDAPFVPQRGFAMAPQGQVDVQLVEEMLRVPEMLPPPPLGVPGGTFMPEGIPEPVIPPGVPGGTFTPEGIPVPVIPPEMMPLPLPQPVLPPEPECVPCTYDYEELMHAWFSSCPTYCL